MLKLQLCDGLLPLITAYNICAVIRISSWAPVGLATFLHKERMNMNEGTHVDHFDWS